MGHRNGSSGLDCDGVRVQYFVGHDAHAHLIETTVSCTGSIQTTLLTGHDPLTGTVHRRLRGRTHGWGGLTGHDQVVLLQMG